jgi:hypothetical protein
LKLKKELTKAGVRKTKTDTDIADAFPQIRSKTTKEVQDRVGVTSRNR